MSTKKIPAPAVWLTRDSFQGVLEWYVDIWDAPPVRHVVTSESVSYVEWLDSDMGTERRVDRRHVTKVGMKFGTVPDDDRQCIKVGG